MRDLKIDKKIYPFAVSVLILVIVVMVPIGVIYIKEKAVLNHIVTESIPEDTFTGVSNTSLSLVEKLEMLSSFSDKNRIVFQSVEKISDEQLLEKVNIELKKMMEMGVVFSFDTSSGQIQRADAMVYMNKQDMNVSCTVINAEIEFTGYHLWILMDMETSQFYSFMLDTSLTYEDSTAYDKDDEFFEQMIDGWCTYIGLDRETITEFFDFSYLPYSIYLY